MSAFRRRAGNARAWLAVCHRWVGLPLAVVLMLSALTGLLLVFHHEIDAALNPQMLSVAERPQPALGPSAIAAAVEARWPAARVEQIYFDREPGQSQRVRLRARDRKTPLPVDEVYVNPWTSEELGGRHFGELRFDRAHLMPMVFRLHQQLLVEPPLGKWITGTAALLWFFHSLSGLLLTLPRRVAGTPGAGATPWLRRWWPAWLVKRTASRARLEFDLHRAAGLWFWIVALVISSSAVYFNLRKEIYAPLVSLFSPVTPAAAEGPPRAAPPGVQAIGYEAAIRAGTALLPEAARTMRLRYVQYLPASASYRLGFEFGGAGTPPWRVGFEQMLLDAHSGALLSRRGTVSGSAGDRWMAWQFPLHTGQAFGWPGRILIACTALAVAGLSFTGLAIWWRRQRARRQHALLQRPVAVPR